MDFFALYSEQWQLISDKFDSLLSGLGIDAGQKTCRCPSPEHEDAHKSAQINLQWQNIHCHTCQKAWKAPQLVEMVLGVSNPREKLRTGLELANLPLPEWWKDPSSYTPSPTPRKIEKFESKPIVPNIDILEIEKRDRAYSEIKKSFPLLPDHRANLQRRGLTDEQIEWGGYRSADADEVLPGFSKSREGGFLCPVRQYGKVAALQIRTANLFAKYRWISKNQSCHIKVADGRTESPLSFLMGDNPERPMLSEGFLKTDIIYLKTGKTCIGASGGNWWAGQAQLLDYLQRYSPIGFDIFADADTIGNPQVARRTWQQILNFQNLGLEVRVANYGQLFDNSLPSPDDWLVSGGDLNSVQWLSAKEFALLCESVGVKILEKSSVQSISNNTDADSSNADNSNADANPDNAEKSSVQSISDGEKNFKEWILDEALKLFHKHPSKNDKQKFIRPTSEVDLSFPEGGRLAAIKAAIAQGYKYILDISPTGTGKSFTAGEMIKEGPEEFGVSRILFITQDPRNITVPGMESVARIDSRHRGITLKNGEQRIAKEGDKLISPPSCFAPEIFAALRRAGIENADSSSIGCVGCPYFNECKSPASKYNQDKPNYLYQRRQGLGQSAMIIHPQSLPQPQGLSQDEKKFAYKKVQQGKDLGSLLYFEEFGGLQANHQIIILQSDVKETFCQLNFNPIDFFDSNTDSAEFFSPILKKLQKIIEEDNSRFGISHQDIISQFDITKLRQAFTKEQLKEIYEAIAPDLSFLKDSVDAKGLSGTEAFSARFALTQEKVKQAESLSKQWLHHFFGVLIGEKLGHLHIAHGQLIINIFNPRIPQIAHEAEINIFSDATLTRDRLAAMIRVKPEQIFVICQETELPPNLKIKQIPLKSYLHRGADQARRIEAAKAEIIARHPNESIATIGSKRAGDQYYWFHHNRGTNTFYNQRIKHLILDGTPVQNISSLEAEYHLLHGLVPTADQLHQFTLEKIYTEFTQALGRPRANLRPDEEITIWMITDLDLSPLGYPVEQVELGSLSLNCLGMVDRLKRKIGEAVKAGAETCQEIAEAVGKTQGRISQIAQEYGGFRSLLKVLKSLLGDLNKEINNPDLDSETLHSLAFEFLGIVGYEGTLLEGIAKAVYIYGQSKFEEAIAALKAIDVGYFEAIIEEVWVELIQITNLNLKMA